MAYSRPLLVVLAGPNGAGKTTASARLLRGALAVHQFVNADTIAQGLSAFRPEEAAMAAGRIMLERLRSLAQARESFAFETTLASRSFAPWLRELRESGYSTHLEFLSLPNPEISVLRVRERVRSGGHHVPEDVVRRRFAGGLHNLFFVYPAVLDDWRLYDNSDTDGYRLIASGASGAAPDIFDQAGWDNLRKQAR